MTRPTRVTTQQRAHLRAFNQYWRSLNLPPGEPIEFAPKPTAEELRRLTLEITAPYV